MQKAEVSTNHKSECAAVGERGERARESERERERERERESNARKRAFPISAALSDPWGVPLFFVARSDMHIPMPLPFSRKSREFW